MKRLILLFAFVPLLLLIGVLTMPIPIGLAGGEATTPTRRYLPVMLNGAPAIEFVQTALQSCDEYCGYGSSSYVLGYVQTTSSTPVSSITLGVNVTVYPYCPFDPCGGSYDEVRISAPAFPVALPGQINPFSYSVVNGKGETHVHGVAWVSGRVAGDGETLYQPLTIVNWTQEGSHMSGSGRNDSGRSLRDIRVVAAALTRCSWREMTLETTTLGPGEVVRFQGDYYCDGDVGVVGQGAVVP